MHDVELRPPVATAAARVASVASVCGKETLQIGLECRPSAKRARACPPEVTKGERSSRPRTRPGAIRGHFVDLRC